MVVAADDMGDVHVVVIDHHGEVVGRRAVGPQQDQVVQVAIAEGDRALDQVAHHRVAVLRAAEADGMGPGQVGRTGVAVAPGRAQGVAGRLGRLAGGGQLVAADSQQR
jgi:hypothetical protein